MVLSMLLTPVYSRHKFLLKASKACEMKGEVKSDHCFDSTSKLLFQPRWTSTSLEISMVKNMDISTAHKGLTGVAGIGLANGFPFCSGTAIGLGNARYTTCRSIRCSPVNDMTGK